MPVLRTELGRAKGSQAASVMSRCSRRRRCLFRWCWQSSSRPRSEKLPAELDAGLDGSPCEAHDFAQRKLCGGVSSGGTRGPCREASSLADTAAEAFTEPPRPLAALPLPPAHERGGVVMSKKIPARTITRDGLRAVLKPLVPLASSVLVAGRRARRYRISSRKREQGQNVGATTSASIADE